jgi:hypothetical protein
MKEIIRYNEEKKKIKNLLIIIRLEMILDKKMKELDSIDILPIVVIVLEERQMI